ncbi:unnamed protein product, partial [Candidula unifasciata]
SDMEQFFAGPVDRRISRVMSVIVIIPTIIVLVVIIKAIVENQIAWNQKTAPFRVTP